MKLKIIVYLMVLVSMATTLCGCGNQKLREDAKELLKDVFIALPGGLKEAKDKVLDPAIEDIKEDAKEIYDAAKPSWEEAFPDLAADKESEEPLESSEEASQESVEP